MQNHLVIARKHGNVLSICTVILLLYADFLCVQSLACSVSKLCPTLCDPRVACQDPLSMGFPRQEYWSGLPLSSGHFPGPGIKPTTPALAGGLFTAEPPRKPAALLLLFSLSVEFHSLRPMDCSMPGFPVLHCLPEFAQIHLH